MKTSIHNEELNLNDPHAQIKYLNIQSLRYVSEQIRTIKENMYSKIYFAFSLVFAIFLSVFARSLNWILILITLDILLLVLVLFARTFYIQRSEHAEINKKIIQQLKKLGVKIKI